MGKQISHLDRVDGASLSQPVSADLLFEAAEAWYRALSVQDPARGIEAAVQAALRSPELAVFDAAPVIQALAMLRRMGYLSPEAVRGH